MKLVLDEVRRLTGPNLLSDHPGAIVDVFIDGYSPADVMDTWIAHLEQCLQTVNWQENYYTRFYSSGASLSISAPMDLLYSACDLLELSWDLCKAQLENDSIDKEARTSALKQSINEEQNPALIRFLAKAKAEKVVCLVDDDDISLGTGFSSQTWPLAELPAIDTVDWRCYKHIPLALVTGTNGKSTSVRLAAQIAKSAGFQAGVTSTDFIKVGDTIIDEGDYSGPGGARMLLRDTRTQIAYLEVARGGLLRRGLPVEHANVALVTNVASDHLGQYGINTVDEIAHVKLMVAKAIKHGSTLVLNADDPLLVKYAEHLDVPICWFSTNINKPLIQNHISAAKPCVFVHEGQIVHSHKKQTLLARVVDVPMTVKGSAKHNIENALGVVGLSIALGIPASAISEGLMTFGSNAQDNPGRTNIYEHNGVTVIIDFAHNAHSMQAVIDMVSKMDCKQTHVMFSHAGDRSNTDITDVTDALHKLTPKTFVLAELEYYLRGREVNEISDLVETHLLAKNVNKTQIVRSKDPLEGAKAALARAEVGDLVLLFTLSDREKVQALLVDG